MPIHSKTSKDEKMPPVISVMKSGSGVLRITVSGRYEIHQVVKILKNKGLDFITNCKNQKRYIVDIKNDMAYLVLETGYDMFRVLDRDGVVTMKPHKNVSEYVTASDVRNAKNV